MAGSSEGDAKTVAMTALQKGSEALLLFQAHERFCEEREQRHNRDHEEVTGKLTELSAKISQGVVRLHERMNEGDAERAKLVQAFTQEIHTLALSNAKASVKQGIIWAAACALTGLAASAIVGAILKGHIG